MNYLWFLLPVLLTVAGVFVYRATTPKFFLELVSLAIKDLVQKISLSDIFKVSPHSKEYWELEHQLMSASSQEERHRLEWALKALIVKEAKK